MKGLKARFLQADPMTALMSRIVPARIRWKPEESICFAFAEAMRGKVGRGVYQGIWFHIPNEGKRGKLSNLVLIALGMIPGCPDYALLWEGNHCLIEFKSEEGYQTRHQKFFQAWCQHAKVSYFLCRSSDEALAVLSEMGAFRYA